MSKIKRESALIGLFSLIGTAGILLLGLIVNPINHYVSGFALFFIAITLYFLEVLLATDRNWLDIRAVFSGVWLGTIGLAALRLTNYQEPWQPMTWVWLAVAYIVFSIGSTLGMTKGSSLFLKIHSKLSRLNVGRISFSQNENRLFWICIITTLVGVVSFVLNALIKGYIPFFSSDPHAYANFYTRFQAFSVAAQAVAGLCYYCIRTIRMEKWKKVLLYLCILYNVVLYPVLIVSRGTFLAAAISFTVTVFYLHKKKLVALILCFAVMFGIYLGCSGLRNYTDEQLSVFFEPAQITVDNGNDKETDVTDNTDFSKNEGTDSETEESPQKVFALSPKAVWVYSYITVSHDNFNEIVQNLEHYTYGTRQLVPINVFLRSDWIRVQNENAEYHQVREHLNTHNLIGDFYYDFGGVGVILCMLLWSFLFGLNQGVYEKNKGWAYLLLLGNTLVPIILSFFSPWTSIFSQWILWGAVFIFAFFCYVKVSPKKKKEQ